MSLFVKHNPATPNGVAPATAPAATPAAAPVAPTPVAIPLCNVPISHDEMREYIRQMAASVQEGFRSFDAKVTTLDGRVTCIDNRLAVIERRCGIVPAAQAPAAPAAPAAQAPAAPAAPVATPVAAPVAAAVTATTAQPAATPAIRRQYYGILYSCYMDGRMVDIYDKDLAEFYSGGRYLTNHVIYESNPQGEVRVAKVLTPTEVDDLRKRGVIS